MKFWEIREPSGSDHAHVRINGQLVHPYRMPDVECETCGQGLSEWNVVHPITCPDSPKDLPELTKEDTAVSMKKFRTLERQILGKQSQKVTESLKPGGFLQPAFLDVPSIPKSDFLWSSLRTGLTTMVVSVRARDLLLQEASGCVEFAPAFPRRIGKRPGSSKPKIPRSGEPANVTRAYQETDESVDTYFQLIVRARSRFLSGTEPGPACKTCGEELEQDWTKENSRMRQREALWKEITADALESIWDGSPIFHLADRGFILISAPLRDQIDKLGLSNVSFREFPLQRAEPSPKKKKSR